MPQNSSRLHMQVCLSGALCITYPLFQDLFCLLDKLSVQVDCVGIYPSYRIVLPEDVVGGLLVVIVRFGRMSLAFF